MRLSEFILANRKPILEEWDAFARTCSPASGGMDITALRDHADEMLDVIVEDLETPQNKTEQDLVGNALEHGSAGTLVTVEVAGDEREATITVDDWCRVERS